MDFLEKKFEIAKNELDNQYNKYMSYIEITILIIATAVISADAVFLANRDVSGIASSSLIGVALGLLSFAYFREKRKEVEQKIKELEQREI